MNVLIDSHMIGSGEGGNERYIRNIFSALQKITNKYNISAYKSPRQSDIYRLLLGIPSEVYKHNYNIVHSTYNTPFVKNALFVVTLHDLSFKRFPSFYSPRDLFMFNTLLPISLARSDAIIVPSQFTQEEVSFFYPQYSKKTTTIWEAADPIFQKISQPSAKKFVSTKWNIHSPYILALNSRNPKKNIQRIVKSFYMINHNFPELKLIVIGGTHHIETKKLAHIHILSSVTDEELNYLYSGAEIFIYYSLYEGFGLPILEALAAGTAVITSDIQVHREITEDKLLYADPHNPQDLAIKLKKLLKDRSCRKSYIQKTESILANYSWEKTAHETLHVYESILQSKNSSQ